MGLLDFNLDNLDSPGARMGLGLLAAAGPQAVPMSFGQRLAGAMGQLRAEKAAEEERKARQQAQAMQAQMLKLQLEQAQRQKDLMQRRDNYLGALDPNAGPTIQPTMAGAMAAGLSPQEFAALNPQPKPSDFKVVGNRLVEISPSGVREAYAPPDKPDLNSLIVTGPDGQPMVNRLLLDAKRQIARDGATQIGLPKIEVKTGEGLAAQVGPMLRDSRAQAEAGMRLVDSANRILTAAEKGNLFAGPTANLQLKGAQIADTFGFGGKNLQEKIKNTRDVVRGMAEQAVSARAQLGGQAQISNSEQELLNKATAGDIAELTAGEIIQIAKLNDRLGRKLYGNHQQQLKVMQQRPELQGVSQFFTVPELPAPRDSATVVRTGRDSQGRKVEQLSDGTIRYGKD